MQADLLNPFLVSLGWNKLFQQSFNESNEAGALPGRIISQGQGHYHVQVAPQLVMEASITNKLRNEAKSPLDYPGVGDWVVVTTGLGTQKGNIHRVLNRKNLLQRKRSGSSRESQLIVTNIDFIFIVTSLNDDFDIQRLSRYLTLATESGAVPILLLTKADLCNNADNYTQQLKSAFGDVIFLKTSSRDTDSYDQLKDFFALGKTSVLIGSSGVGKSTLTNYLLNLNHQSTRDLSGEAKGRHTTTSRNLFVTRWGGLVIDTPGMQDVSTFKSTEDTQNIFQDIEDLMLQCKFTNCRHSKDPGCAISAGLKKGTLSSERWGEFLNFKNG